MATTIITKYGSGAPAASDVVRGELAVDTENGRLYTETSGGAVIEIGLNPSGNVDVTGTVTADSFEVDDTDDIRLRFLNASTFKGGIQIATSAGDMIGTSAVDDLCIRGQSDILFATGGNTERMKIVDTGIDVTGTVTADGLTVDGSGTEVKFTTTAGRMDLFLTDTDTTEGQVRVRGDANALSFITDTKVRQSIASNGDISFYEDTGTTPKLTWDASAESLGIGTASPSAKLDIFDSGAGNANSAAIELTNYDYGVGETGQSVSIESLVRNDGGGTSTTGKIVFGKDSDYSSAANRDGNIQFYTNQSNSVTEAMRIDSAGNLLVGTTNSLPADNSVEGIALSPQYDGGIIQVSRTGQAGLTVNRRTSDGDIQLFKKDGSTVGQINARSGDLVVGTGDTGLQFYDVGDAIFPLSASGNTNRDGAIDLGETNNRFKDLYLSGGVSTNTTTGLSITANATNRGQLNLSTSQSYQLLGGAYYGYTGYKTGGYHRWFGSDGAEDMRLDSSGNLLVGTTDNTLVGRTDTGRVCIDNEDGNDCIQLKGSGVDHLNIASWIPISGGGYHIGFGDGTSSYTERGVISTNGSVTNYGGTSDYRLKENITDLSDAITRVKQLSPKRFNFIDHPDTTIDGFIAHEVQDIVPEAVVGEKDATKEDGTPRYQMLDASKLIPILTKAIQEQQDLIESLTARIAALEGAN